jgi:UDP-N-acetylmuramoyl-tripeptide--D-alanyl-D-alanine ligase
MSVMMTLRQARPWLSGAQQKGSGDEQVVRVHTDTRTVEPGDLFVALKGERFDANDFLAEAQHRGAVAAICHADAAKSLVGFPCIVVPDTKVALGELATGWRARFDLPLIAVTGSNGKTTVTQMIASILKAAHGEKHSLATRGNFNNDIGVPLTLLRLRPEHRIAVVEMGMNHPGEIASLSAMAQPTVALVNNAQREHLEFMHTVQAVAQENGAVIASLPSQGVAVFPCDDAHSAVWRGLAGSQRIVEFSMDVQAGETRLVCVAAQWHDGAWQVLARGLGVELRYRLSIAGRHNVKNSLAAAACALAAGVTSGAVERGLEAFLPVKGRSRALSVAIDGRACTLIDDTYNANPDSVQAAIDVLADLPGPRLLVLGDMGEVGSDGPQLHAEAGRYAQARGIEHVLVIGALAQYTSDNCVLALHFETMDALHIAVNTLLPTVNSILVKGSRFMRMERVVDALLAHNLAVKESAHAV